MKTKKLLLLVFTLLLVTCLVFGACVQLDSNAITGLQDITLHCGEIPNLTAVSAEYGTPVFEIAEAQDGTAAEQLTYRSLTSDSKLVEGTYYIKAYVAVGESYESAVAYAKVTVTHQAFDAISGSATHRTEVNGNQYHTWDEKTCTCGATVIGNDQTITKEETVISGLDDITLVCGSKLELSGVSTNHGEIVYSWSKDQQNYVNLNPEQVFNQGTYYLRAFVGTGDTYLTAVKDVKITVNHQAFEDIAGEGEFHDEVTSDNKYHSWYEKTCTCGAVVKGNESTVDKLQNAVTGLADVNLVCGSALDISGIAATHGNVKVEIAKAVEGTAKEDHNYAAISGVLNHGTYYVRATVAEGKNYLGVVAYATVTVNHQSFEAIDAAGNFKYETTSDSKYHTWYEKTCACGAIVKGGDQTIDKKPNEITGLADGITFICKQDFAISGVGSTYGTVVLEIATAVEGTAKEDLDYKPYTGSFEAAHGIYYVRATVAEGDDYAAQTRIVKVVVNHQAFADIAGDGEFKSEVTADDKYHSWTEKSCVCGETIIGNDTTVDRLQNAVTGLQDATLTCGSTLDVSGIAATHGSVKIEIAKAVEGTAKENLTYAAISGALNHGTYYVRVTVAEAHSYYGVVAYAQVTVAHKAYADITGDAEHVAPANNVNGYDYKTCACGAQIKGEKEYVLVTIKVDGEVVDAQDLEIGAKVTVPAESKLPAREGYVLILLDSENEQWQAGETASEFATIEINAYWLHRTEHSISKVNINWLFIANEDTGLTEETVNTLTEDTENKLWIVETMFNKDKPSSPAELTLGNIKFEVGHTYVLTLKSEHATFVTFGTDTWEKNAYLIGSEDIGKEIVITITYTGTETIVTYNGEARSYTNAEWSNHNLNGLNLCIQYKPQDMSASSERFKVYISDTVVDLHDYTAAEAALVATLPEASAIDADNVEEVEATLKKIAELRKLFSDSELKKAVDITAQTSAVNALLADHVFNLEKLGKALPEFDTIWDADKDTQYATYKALTKYLAYYNLKFTEEEKAVYTEPEKIAFYREYFANHSTFGSLVTDNASAEMSGFAFWDNKPEQKKFNPNNTSGTLTLPQIAYGAFENVNFILIGSERVVITFAGQEFSKGADAPWVRFTVSKGSDGDWYVTAKLLEEGPEVTVKLDEAVVLGNQALEAGISTSTWSLVYVQGSGNSATLDYINGTLDTTDATTVHQVSYSYTTGAGQQSTMQYYLNDKQLVLPTVPAYYEDEIGKHTFIGWFVEDVEHKAGEAVTGDLALVAKYEVKEGDYIEYEVAFIEGNTDWCDPQTYHYGDALELPTDTPTREGGSGFHWEFKGWFDGETQYKGGEIITGDLELVAKMVSVPDDVPQRTVTLTNLDGDNQTVDVLDGEVAELPTVTRSGYVFEGWYLNGAKYDTTATVTGDITLVAKWLVPTADTQRKDIWNATEATSNDITFSDGGRVDACEVVDPSSSNDNWKYDENHVFFTNSVQYTWNNGGTVTLTLPLINFKNYTDVRIALQKATAGSSNTFEVCGVEHSDNAVLYINTANGTFQIKGFAASEVLANGTIPADVLNGTTGLTFTFTFDAAYSWVKVFNIHAIGSSNVDYVAKATEAATAIGNLASDASQDDKIAALKEYRSWRNHFTSYELANNAKPSAVTALENELTEWVNIWTPTEGSTGGISVVENEQYNNGINYVDLKAQYDSTEDGTDKSWSWKIDKDRKNFDKIYQFEPNKDAGDNFSTQRSVTLALPAINFTEYVEARFMLYIASNNTDYSLAIKGVDNVTLPRQKNSETNAEQTFSCYVVYIKTVDGTMTFEVCHNVDSTVVASGTLSNAVANGTEGLQLTVTVNSWSSVQISEIHGLRGLTKAIWTPTAENAGDIGFSGTSDAVGQITTAADNLVYDKNGVAFDSNAFYRNCNVQDAVLTLPKINFAMYSEVKFGFYVQDLGDGATKNSLTINDKTVDGQAVKDSKYVVYIKTANGQTTFEICYSGSRTVLASGTLSDAVAHGQEALSVTIGLDAWTRIQMTSIIGTL